MMAMMMMIRKSNDTDKVAFEVVLIVLMMIIVMAVKVMARGMIMVQLALMTSNYMITTLMPLIPV